MDLFKLVGKLAIEGVDKAERDINKVSGSAEQTSGKMSKLGNFMGKVGKGVLVATGAAVTGAVGLVKSVSSSYGQLQQSIGGVETLFKESADKVIKNANNAYTTAGISANEYMQQVTSFSASLLQGLGGDTEKAANYADMAITDMADNANKMGTSMEMIQNAYQGFAKQNYTMLDNLKLGYGGTKSEMARLVKDSGILGDAAADLTAKNLDEKVSFDQIVEAINITQQRMGITGTTAKEAGETIEGSFNSLGASWQNFLAGLGDPNADMQMLVGNLAKGISGAVNNIIPVINNMVAVLPTVMDAIVNAIEQMLPTLIKTFTELITKVIDAIVKLLPQFIPLAIQCVLTVAQAIIENLPLIVDAAIQLVLGLAKGISDALPQLMPTVVNVVVAIVTKLVENVPLLIEGAITLFMAIVDAIPVIITELTKALPQIVKTIVTVLVNNVPLLLKSAITLFMAIVKAIPTIVRELVVAVPQIVKAIIEGLSSIPSKIGKVLSNALTNVKKWLSNMKNTAKNGIITVANTIISTLNKVPAQMVTIGKNIVTGIWNGIAGAFGWIKEKIGGFTDGVVGTFKNLLGIHSPSRVMRDKVGKFIVQGIAVGIDSDTSAEDAMRTKVGNMLDVANASFNSITFNPSINDFNPSINDFKGVNPMTEYQIKFNAQFSALNDGFERLISLVGQYLPGIADGMNRDIVLDGNSLVVGMSRKMDNQLGRLAVAKGRGNV